MYTQEGYNLVLRHFPHPVALFQLLWHMFLNPCPEEYQTFYDVEVNVKKGCIFQSTYVLFFYLSMTGPL